MSAPVFRMAVRLRLVSASLAAVGMLAVIVMVGALFPAVGDSIGKLDLPKGVSDLLGGADYRTITGWMRSEIVAVYAPLVVAGTAISAAVAMPAEEESGVLALTLAHPVMRSQLVVSKAGGVAVSVLIVVVGTFVGLVAGVAIGGGGIPVGDLAALSVHLAFFGWALGAIALVLGAATGIRAVAAATAAAVAVAHFLINGFAPLIDGLDWLKYLSLFYYYEGHDPLGNGVHAVDLVVLGAVAVVLTAVATMAISRRDLRK
jgi:ABC-2 type transport system permease protein